MKYCSNCGSPIEEGDQFCIKCGTPVQTVEEPVTGQETDKETGIEPQPDAATEVTPGEKKKTGGFFTNKKLLAAILGAAALVAIVLIVVFTGKKTIKLEDYICEPVINGPDGAAIASIDEGDGDEYDYREDIKELALANTIWKAMGNDGTLDMQYELGELPETVQGILDCVECKVVSKKKDLSNGDKVKIKAEFKATLPKEMKFKLKNGTKTFTVKDLLPAKEIDPFEYLDIQYQGVTSHLKIADDSYRPKGEPPIPIYYTFSNNDEIKAGDVITVTANYYDESTEEISEDPVGNQEYIFSKKTKDYKCEAGEIGEESLKALEKDGSSVLKERFDEYYSDDISYSELKLLGTYFLSRKDQEGEEHIFGHSDNYMYLVFTSQVSVIDDDSDIKNKTVYIPVELEKYTLSDNGKVNYSPEDLEETFCVDSDSGDWPYWLPSFYTDGSRAFNDLVKDQEQEYYYEVSEKLQQFGK